MVRSSSFSRLSLTAGGLGTGVLEDKNNSPLVEQTNSGSNEHSGWPRHHQFMESAANFANLNRQKNARSDLHHNVLWKLLTIKLPVAIALNINDLRWSLHSLLCRNPQMVQFSAQSIPHFVQRSATKFGLSAAKRRKNVQPRRKSCKISGGFRQPRSSPQQLTN
jgi:hypothetical protein